MYSDAIVVVVVIVVVIVDAIVVVIVVIVVVIVETSEGVLIEEVTLIISKCVEKFHILYLYCL